MFEEEAALIQQTADVARNAQDQADAIAEVLQGYDTRLVALEGEVVDQWAPEGLSANVRGFLRTTYEAERWMRTADRWMDEHHKLFMDLHKAVQGLMVSPRGGDGGGSA